MPNPFTIPGAPAELMERINARRARFAPGMTMMADPVTPPPIDQSSDDDDDLGGFKSKESKESALADLATERRARRDLEVKFARVAEAFGVKAEKGAKPDEAVAQLTNVVATIQRELAVERLARQHGIHDEDDIAALLAVSDEAARIKLAARLAPVDSGGDSGDSGDNQPRPRLPKPDGTQGSKGDSIKPPARPGLPRLTEGITAALESNN